MEALRLHSPDEPVYTIGVVARLLGISPQSLRQFEREGLVAPTRTEANIRLYSQNELVILRRICELVKIEGVNIAGVRAVLRIERRYGVYEAVEGPGAGPFEDSADDRQDNPADDASGSARSRGQARRDRGDRGDWSEWGGWGDWGFF